MVDSIEQPLTPHNFRCGIVSLFLSNYHQTAIVSNQEIMDEPQLSRLPDEVSEADLLLSLFEHQE